MDWVNGIGSGPKNGCNRHQAFVGGVTSLWFILYSQRNLVKRVQEYLHSDFVPQHHHFLLGLSLFTVS
jgi:hypothetical protein